MATSPGGRPADDSPTGHGGDNWVTRAGGLPSYHREIWHALVRKGMAPDRAYATAIESVRHMAEGRGPNGKGKVSAKVQAAAVAASAEFEAKRHLHLSNVDPAHAQAALKGHYPKRVTRWVKGARWERKSVPLADIQMQHRPGKPHDAAKVKAIRKTIRKGAPLHPVLLVDTGKGQHKIADGYHRTAALKREGMTHADALVAHVRKRTGPWSRAMHDAKLNTRKGKS